MTGPGAEGRTRVSSPAELKLPDVVCAFLDRYREQIAAATDPAGKDSGCADWLRSQRVDALWLG